jgi:hypothetical protein
MKTATMTLEAWEPPTLAEYYKVIHISDQPMPHQKLARGTRQNLANRRFVYEIHKNNFKNFFGRVQE